MIRLKKGFFTVFMILFIVGFSDKVFAAENPLNDILNADSNVISNSENGLSVNQSVNEYSSSVTEDVPNSVIDSGIDTSVDQNMDNVNIETNEYSNNDSSYDVNSEEDLNQNYDGLDSDNNNSYSLDESEIDNDEIVADINSSEETDSGWNTDENEDSTDENLTLSNDNFNKMLKLLTTAGIFIEIVSSLFFVLIITLLNLIIISNAKIYEKAGYYAWKSVIPVYNSYILYKFTWGNGLLCILSFLPIIGFIMSIVTKYKLNNAFGGSGITFVIFLLAPVVAYPMIAFSEDAEYIGDFEGDDC